VVDLCAGKGFLTMCIGHGALGGHTPVRRVVVVEKAVINWSHLKSAKNRPDAALRDGAPAVELATGGKVILTRSVYFIGNHPYKTNTAA
jgi:hypothetical protein